MHHVPAGSVVFDERCRRRGRRDPQGGRSGRGDQRSPAETDPSLHQRRRRAAQLLRGRCHRLRRRPWRRPEPGRGADGKCAGFDQQARRQSAPGREADREEIRRIWRPGVVGAGERSQNGQRARVLCMPGTWPTWSRSR